MKDKKKEQKTFLIMFFYRSHNFYAWKIFFKNRFSVFLIQDYRLEKFYWISNMCSTAEATPELQGFFLWRFFATWRQKKGLANPTKGILRF
jgi:hypothetical protein